MPSALAIWVMALGSIHPCSTANRVRSYLLSHIPGKFMEVR
jgi:hypothetical protein